MSEGSPVGAHVIKMMGYIQTLEKLGFALNDELAIDVVQQLLPDSFSQFILNFNMNEIEKTLPQLLGMLRTAEGNMKKGGSKSVLMVREAKGKGKGKKVAKSKGNGKTKPKGKEALKPKGGVSKDGKCFHCGKTGHWKRNCPIYLEDVKKAKAVGASVSGIYVIDVHMSTSSSWVLDTGCGSHICTSVQGLHTRMTLAKGDVDLRVGNGARVAALAVGTYVLYGYIYLMRHKSEALEKFKEFKNDVQNQHDKSIKALRSDRGGEYLSQDFDELLKECGIVSQLTPPGTPQWNGVSERRNRTLLDMFYAGNDQPGRIKSQQYCEVVLKLLRSQRPRNHQGIMSAQIFQPRPKDKIQEGILIASEYSSISLIQICSKSSTRRRLALF
ncbi:hypothetical protein GQ457_05G020930 [Hibiscus cannabinus]